MSTAAPTPDTVVLIHGFWVTPRSWEHWIDRYEQRGHRVLAPAYPGFEVEVEALNADPSPIEALTVPAIIEHLEAVIGELESPPILIGHSAGGAFTQILLDHGFGSVGVAINSAPTEGVKVVPLSQIKASFPVLKNPANRHKAVGPHARAMALHVHQHLQRRRVASAVRALPHPGFRTGLLGQRAGEHPPRPRRHVRQLQERRPGAVAVHLGQRGPPHAPEDPAVERQALQGGWDRHRGQGVRGTASAPRPRRLGRGRRLRPRLGRRPRRADGRCGRVERWLSTNR